MDTKETKTDDEIETYRELVKLQEQKLVRAKQIAQSAIGYIEHITPNDAHATALKSALEAL